MTRQSRPSLEDDEAHMNKMLEDAGLLEADMSMQEKQQLLKVLQESKDGSSQRISPNCQSPSEQNASTSSESQNEKSSSKTLMSKGEHCLSDGDDLRDSSDQEFDCGGTGKDSSEESKRSQLKESKNPCFIEDRSCNVSRRDVSERSETSGRPLREVPRGRGGRGRAIPSKRYEPLPVIKPGKKNVPTPSQYFNSLNSNTKSQIDVAQGSSNSPDPFDSLLSPSSSENDPVSPQNHLSSPSTLRQNTPSEEAECTTVSADSNFKDADRDIGDTINNEIDVDIESVDKKCEQKQNVNSSFDDIQANSPASVEDAEDGDDSKSTCKPKCCVGKFFSQRSTLETLVKNITVRSSLSCFDDLEKYRGNKQEWMENAKRIVTIHQRVYWDKVLKEKPHWGPPIPDGGYNKDTLFKQITPKYSKLFSSPSEKQGPSSSSGWSVGREVRLAKSQAVTKIQGFVLDEWLDPEQDFKVPRKPNQRVKDVKDDEWQDDNFLSLRKSRQRTKELAEKDLPDTKQGQQNNVRKSEKNTDSFIEDDDVKGEHIAAHQRWNSDGVEQKAKSLDSDSEVQPDLPRDPYEFDANENDNEDQEEIWDTARNKRNQRKGGKGAGDDPVVEAKTLPRTRAANLGKKSKLRLQNKAISHPSEHVNSKEPRNRGDSSSQYEGETSKRNNVHSENRGWLTTAPTTSDNSQGIPPNKFFSSQGIQPMIPRSTGQQRKAVKENRRPSDSAPSPSTSGSNTARPQDRVDDSAVSAVKVACPICNRLFYTNEIENHASGCLDYSGAAEGE